MAAGAIVASKAYRWEDPLRDGYVDPIDAVVALAIIAIFSMRGEKGVKISFTAHRVTIDHSGMLQGILRMIKGADHAQLAQLTPALYCASSWLAEVKDQNIKTLFALARLGVSSLVEDYRDQHSDHPAIHTLTDGPLTILDAFINHYRIPDKTTLAIPGVEESSVYSMARTIWTAENFRLPRAFAKKISKIVCVVGDEICLSNLDKERADKNLGKVDAAIGVVVGCILNPPLTEEGGYEKSSVERA